MTRIRMTKTTMDIPRSSWDLYEHALKFYPSSFPLACYLLYRIWHWKWRQYALPKRRWTSTELHFRTEWSVAVQINYKEIDFVGFLRAVREQGWFVHPCSLPRVYKGTDIMRRDRECNFHGNCVWIASGPKSRLNCKIWCRTRAIVYAIDVWAYIHQFRPSLTFSFFKLNIL
jgi:hypothetical protein